MGSGPSPDTNSAITLILDFPASRTLKTCLMCPVYSILLYQSKHNWDRVKVKTLKKNKNMWNSKLCTFQVPLEAMKDL